MLPEPGQEPGESCVAMAVRPGLQEPREMAGSRRLAERTADGRAAVKILQNTSNYLKTLQDIRASMRGL